MLNLFKQITKSSQTLTRVFPAKSWKTPHEGHRPEGNLIREVIFGANDGFVSNIALVGALAGATNDPKIIVLGGIAGLTAGALSMGLGAYISSKSEKEFREAEERRERWEIEHMRDLEIAETRNIFIAKGLSGALLDEVVAVVTSDPDKWVDLMMTEELGFPDSAPKPKTNAIVMALSFAFAAFSPVAPFIFLEGQIALALSVIGTAIALICLSAWRSYLTSGKFFKQAFEMLFLAAIAVIASNIIGRLVGQTIF